MIEIRVHGMGDHTDGSALGNPPVKVARYPDMPDTAIPPPLPRHDVRLINWSRTSRRALRLLWYLALPMTLVNVMGFMSPDGKRNALARGTLRAVTIVVGLTVTITVQVWLIAIGETFFRPIEFAAENAELVGDAITVVVTGGLLLIIVIRWIRGRAILRTSAGLSELRHESRWLAGVSLASLAVVAACGGIIRFAPPTQWPATWAYLRVPTPPDQNALQALMERYPGMSLSAAICRAEKTGHANELVERLDPLNAVVIAGLAVAVVAWVLLVIARATGDHAARAPMAGAALISVIAVIGINAVGATLRLGLEWVMVYLDTLSSLGWIDRNRGMSLYERHIVAFQGQRIPECRTDTGFIFNSTYYLDSLPLFMIFAGISLALALWLVNASDFSRITHRDRASGRKRLLLFSHVVVERLSTRLVPAMLLALPIWAVMSAISLYAVDVHTGSATLFWSDVVRVVAQAVAVIAVLFVIFGGRLGGIRQVLSTIADIAGFWDTAYHPLAGDTYRRKVMAGIADDVASLPAEEPVVLVGHSQGSVLVAWFAAHLPHRPIALVTCGSPLVSLYSAFFPRYFGAGFRSRVDEKTLSWDNLWRRTDPIATQVRGELDPSRDHLLDDPVDCREDPTPHGHSDYWIDPTQMKVVADAGSQELRED